ncbi:hypothetical protein BaRGS_00018998, partial [Batillaria attramentaria]
QRIHMKFTQLSMHNEALAQTLNGIPGARSNKKRAIEEINSSPVSAAKQHVVFTGP